MRRIGCYALAIVLLPAWAWAVMADDPPDLSRWVVTYAPNVGDGRWLAANNDADHEWVVSLKRGRPSVRLRAYKREKGSPYPETQEFYPPMPFVVKQGTAAEGLAGEWFSAKVSDGWVIGFNAGEFGAGLWWYSPDGKDRYKISKDQVVGFLQTDVGLLALEGLAHGMGSRGRIVRLSQDKDGRWKSRPFVDLKGAPAVAVKAEDGTLLVATFDRLLKVDPATKKVDVLLKDAFWGGLYPKSMIVEPSGTVFLGMRHGVAKVEKVGPGYRARWLLPKPEAPEGPATFRES